MDRNSAIGGYPRLMEGTLAEVVSACLAPEGIVALTPPPQQYAAWLRFSLVRLWCVHETVRAVLVFGSDVLLGRVCMKDTVPIPERQFQRFRFCFRLVENGSDGSCFWFLRFGFLCHSEYDFHRDGGVNHARRRSYAATQIIACIHRMVSVHRVGMRLDLSAQEWESLLTQWPEKAD